MWKLGMAGIIGLALLGALVGCASTGTSLTGQGSISTRGAVSGDWITKWGDAGNTSSATVRLGTDATQVWTATYGGHPLFYNSPTLGQVVVSGPYVYSAANGAFIQALPGDSSHNDNGAAIDATTSTLLGFNGTYFHAHDLGTTGCPLKWTTDPSVADSQAVPLVDWGPVSDLAGINADAGTFYVIYGGVLTDGSRWGVREVQADGTLGWCTTAHDLGMTGAPFAAAFGLPSISSSAVALGIDALMGGDGGRVVLDRSSGALLWKVVGDGQSYRSACIVDGLAVFADATSDGTNSVTAHALTAAGTTPEWTAQVDRTVFSPPSVGSVAGETAVFVATTAGSVYAFSAATGDMLWEAPVCLGSTIYAPAVYGDGRLHVSPSDGRTYILDADTGQVLTVLNTENLGQAGSDPPLLAKAELASGLSAVMYFRNQGLLEAWSGGDAPSAPTYTLTLSAEPTTIAPRAESALTATLTMTDAGVTTPVEGAEVTFMHDAAKNQGYVSPTKPITAEGVATATFYSESRTGTITVTASAFGQTASVVITVSDSAEPPPPPPAGSIVGTVTDASTGKAVRKATVTAIGPVTATAATNTKGTYSLTDLPTGIYEVQATKDGVAGAAVLTSVTAGETSTVDLTL